MTLLASLWKMLTTRKGNVRQAKPDDATRLTAQGALVLDVREASEYRAGHVPGAVNIPLSEVESRIAELPKDRPIVVHCAHGRRGAAACSILGERGLDVTNVEGGLTAWKDAGQQTEK